MFEPMALPRASPLSPFREATMLVTSSGRDVPIATIVRPISVSLRPRDAAIAEALSTTVSPPNTTAARPKMM